MWNYSIEKGVKCIACKHTVFFVVDQAENGDCEERWSKNVLSVVCAISNVFMQFGVDYIKLRSPFTKKKVVYVTKSINSQYLFKILFNRS